MARLLSGGNINNPIDPAYTTEGPGVIFKLTPTGVETILYLFTGENEDGASPSGLIQGSDGNFYGTAYYGNWFDLPSGYSGPEPDFGSGTVFKLSY